MIINISADTVVWYIAIMLTVLSVLLFLILMALRVATAVINLRLTELQKKIPRFGGGADVRDGEAGGMGGLLQIVGGLFGGGK